LGGANRKYRLVDENGHEWLFKPQPRVQCLFDVAAAATSRSAGVLSPIVYDRQLEVRGARQWGSLQPLIESGRITHVELPEDMSALGDPQRQELQRHQVVDWLIANADPHRKQFLIVDHAFLIGIDKSQSMRFFPHDRLRWDAHAWWVNRLRPVYADLFAGAKSGTYTLDPAVAVSFAAHVSTSVDGAWLRDTWRPVIASWYPPRLVWALGTTRLGPRAVDAVLAKIERRKQGLPAEFRKLYYIRSHKVW
jgi:hypothetical protein